MQIRTLEPRRLREAAKVLSEAFTDEPVIAQMLPLGTLHRQRKIADYFVWSMRLSGLDTVDVAIDPQTDRIVGVARWRRPGHVTRWYSGLPATPGVLRGVGRRGLRALDAYEAAGAGKHPAEPHWHLVGVGTSASARGIGLGTTLLEHRLSAIDAASCIASVEASSPRSAEFYARLGFAQQHELDGAASGACVMWRQPNAQSGQIAA